MIEDIRIKLGLSLLLVAGALALTTSEETPEPKKVVPIKYPKKTKGKPTAQTSKVKTPKSAPAEFRDALSQSAPSTAPRGTVPPKPTKKTPQVKKKESPSTNTARPGQRGLPPFFPRGSQSVEQPKDSATSQGRGLTSSYSARREQVQTTDVSQPSTSQPTPENSEEPSDGSDSESDPIETPITSEPAFLFTQIPPGSQFSSTSFSLSGKCYYNRGISVDYENQDAHFIDVQTRLNCGVCLGETTLTAEQTNQGCFSLSVSVRGRSGPRSIHLNQDEKRLSARLVYTKQSQLSLLLTPPIRGVRTSHRGRWTATTSGLSHEPILLFPGTHRLTGSSSQVDLFLDGQRTQTLKSPDSSRFGEGLAIGTKHLLIGAPGEMDEAGRVYIYEKTSDQWNLTGHLNHPNPEDATSQWFGSMVHFLSDSTVAISAPYPMGKVYLYGHTENGWTPISEISEPETRLFGWALKGDLNHLAVGAPASNQLKGNVYFYEDAKQHALLAKIEGPNSQALFGYALAWDSETLAVSAPFDQASNGSVFLYHPFLNRGLAQQGGQGNLPWSESALRMGGLPLSTFGCGMDSREGELFVMSCSRGQILQGLHVSVFETSPQGTIFQYRAALGPSLASVQALPDGGFSVSGSSGLTLIE